MIKSTYRHGWNCFELYLINKFCLKRAFLFAEKNSSISRVKTVNFAIVKTYKSAWLSLDFSTISKQKFYIFKEWIQLMAIHFILI